MPIYPKAKRNDPDVIERAIPDSVLKRAKNKETLQWLYDNAPRIEKKYGLPQGILLPLAGHESGHYNPGAKSGTGPVGLFQLSEYIGKAYGMKMGADGDDRYDLEKSANAAARLLQENLRRNKGDVVKALAQYNGGMEASKWVDGRTHLYDTGNGNPGELYGFMRGVANYAKEWGNDTLYDSLLPAYQDRRQEIIDMKTKMNQNGYDFDENGSWNREISKAWDKVSAKGDTDLISERIRVADSPEEKTKTKPVNIPGAKSTLGFMGKQEEPKKSNSVAPNFDFSTPPMIKKPQNQVEVSAENPDAPKPKKPAKANYTNPVNPKKKERSSNEIRIYKTGGRLTQLSSDGKETDLQGEERVYSIPDTKAFVKLAMKAKSESDLIELGKKVYKATKKQDEREPEMTDD